MKFSNHIGFGDHSTSSESPGWFSILHRIACTAGALLAVWCLFRCMLAFHGALQDARKFGGLGFSYPFHHYLGKNDFWEDAGLFLLVLAEFLLYIGLCRRAERLEPFRGGSWYFTVMLVLHAAIWIHANFMLPGNGFESPVSIAEYYRYYADMTLLPSAAYFTLYLLRIRRISL